MKNYQQQTEKAESPTPHDVLTRCLSGYKLSGKRWPDSMPILPSDAADWWMSYQERRVRYESQEDYARRLFINLMSFLVMNEDDQRFILAAVCDGIAWRGDPIKHFEVIVSEHEKMRDMGVEQYRNTIKLPTLKKQE